MENDFNSIKVADFSDIECIVKLANELWTKAQAEELKTEFIELLANHNVCIFLKQINGLSIGFAQCQLRFDYVEGTQFSPVGYLEGVYVKPEYRNKGYAKQLLTACEKWAKEKGCKEFASDCELDNVASLRFHLASGFSEVNRIICFFKTL